MSFGAACVATSSLQHRHESTGPGTPQLAYTDQQQLVGRRRGADPLCDDLMLDELPAESARDNNSNLQCLLTEARQQRRLLASARRSPDAQLRWLLRQLDVLYARVQALQGVADGARRSILQSLDARIELLTSTASADDKALADAADQSRTAEHQASPSPPPLPLPPSALKNASNDNDHDGDGGRSSQSVSAVHSLVRVLCGGDAATASSALTAIAGCVDTCARLWRAGCVPLLVGLAHASLSSTDNTPPSPHYNQQRQLALRAAASAALLTAAQQRPPVERRVLRLLRRVREFSERLCPAVDGRPTATAAVADATATHPLSALAIVLKMSYSERRRATLRQLGAVQSVCEALTVDAQAHGRLTYVEQCMTLRRLAAMTLTNLTYGQPASKLVVSSQPAVLRAVVDLLSCPAAADAQDAGEEDAASGDSPRQQAALAAASLLRNLSWRADARRRRALRDSDAASKLAAAAMSAGRCHHQPVLRCALSALWNLSAHCRLQRAQLCRLHGWLAFLVQVLTASMSNDSIGGDGENSELSGVTENASGVLRNLSVHLAGDATARACLLDTPCLSTLLELLSTSSNTTVVHNACVTLCCLASAGQCADVRQQLWLLGGVERLRALTTSDHRQIAAASSAALRHLLLAVSNSPAAAGDLPNLRSLTLPACGDAVEATDDAERLSPTVTCDVRQCAATFLPDVDGDAEAGSTASARAVALVRQVARRAGISGARLQQMLASPSGDTAAAVDAEETSDGAAAVAAQQQAIIDEPSESALDYPVRYLSSERGSPQCDPHRTASADQPTDFSARYAEDHEEDDECASVVDQVDEVEHDDAAFKKTAVPAARGLTRSNKMACDAVDGLQDTVQTYATEGTPCLGTPHAFSAAVSLLDLRETPTSRTSAAAATVTASLLCSSAGNAAINSATTSAAAAVGSVSVTETPLVFSRSSSVGSLGSCLMNNADGDLSAVDEEADEHHSVASVYSRPLTEPVSPSELPDSPGDQPRGPLVVQRPAAAVTGAEMGTASGPPAGVSGCDERVGQSSTAVDVDGKQVAEAPGSVESVAEIVQLTSAAVEQVADDARHVQRTSDVFSVDVDNGDDDDMIYACIKSAMPTGSVGLAPASLRLSSGLSLSARKDKSQHSDTTCGGQPVSYTSKPTQLGDKSTREVTRFSRADADDASADVESDDLLLDQMIRQSMHDRHSGRHRGLCDRSLSDSRPSPLVARASGPARNQFGSGVRPMVSGGDESGSVSCRLPPRTPPSVAEKARIYAVEGTPLHFSTATSLSDLTLDEAMSTRSAVGGGDVGQVDVAASSLNSQQFKLYEDYSRVYATEDTPAVFSRCDSLSDIVHDADVDPGAVPRSISAIPACIEEEPGVGDSASSLLSSNGSQKPATASLLAEQDDGSETDDMLLERCINSAMPKSRSETSVRRQRRNKQRSSRSHQQGERRCSSSRDVSSRVRAAARLPTAPSALSHSAFIGGNCGSVRVLANFSCDSAAAVDRHATAGYDSLAAHYRMHPDSAINSVDGVLKRYPVVNGRYHKENTDRCVSPSTRNVETSRSNADTRSPRLGPRVVKPAMNTCQASSTPSSDANPPSEVKSVRGRRKSLYPGRSGRHLTSGSTSHRPAMQNCLSPRDNRATQLRRVLSAPSNDHSVVRVRSENSSPANSKSGSPLFAPRRFGSAGKGGVVMCQLPQRRGSLQNKLAAASLHSGAESNSHTGSPSRTVPTGCGLTSNSGMSYRGRGLKFNAASSEKSRDKKSSSRHSPHTHQSPAKQGSAIERSVIRPPQCADPSLKCALTERHSKSSPLEIIGDKCQVLHSTKPPTDNALPCSSVLKKEGTFTLGDPPFPDREVFEPEEPYHVESLSLSPKHNAVSLLKHVEEPIDTLLPVKNGVPPIRNNSNRARLGVDCASELCSSTNTCDLRTGDNRGSFSNRNSKLPIAGQWRVSEHSPLKRGKVIITDL